MRSVPTGKVGVGGYSFFKILPDYSPYGTPLDGRHGQEGTTDYH
jgi:hypothetical protein